MKTTLILCGKLFDGIHSELQPNMEILVCGDRIDKVGRNLPRPEGCEIVDLSDKTVTPGMIDAHVHSDAFDNNKMFMESIFASSTYRALGSLHTMQRALRRGFTAIRVPGCIESFDYGIADVARSIERGYFAGSRLVYSFAALGTTGGPLIMGLVFGHFAKVGSVDITVPTPVLKTFRELGLVLFLIGAGLDGGAGFVETLKTEGVMLFVYGAVMTLLPMIVGFLVAAKVLKLSIFNNLGSITGGMTSTPALGTLIQVAGTDDVASAYAATYPIALVCVVLVSQFIVLLF